MVRIKVANDYSYLQTQDFELKEKLYNTFRFRNRNYYHSRLYKQNLWDGFTNFLDKKSGKFLSGLLPEMEVVLKHFNITYEIIDERENVLFAYDNVNDQFLNNWLPEGQKPITLEDYQVDFINHAIKYKRGIIKAPTSAGKTYILLGIMKSLPPDTPMLFLVNRKTLINQNYEEMVKWGFTNIGKLGGSSKSPNTITCATVQSLHHIEDMLPKFKALFVDEVHLMTSTQSVRAYKKLKGCRIRIGLSATPFKFGEKDNVQKYTVRGFFGPVFKTKTVKDGILTTKYLQERGRLSASHCTFYIIDEPQIPYHVYQDAITVGLAESWHLHKIVQKLTNTLSGRILILVERIAHGDALHNLIPGSLWIQGKDNDDTRKYVIDKLKSSKEKVIAIATKKIFDTGVNLMLHSVINASGGTAQHQIIQMMGRGLRTADDKEILKYYDFVFKINPYLEKHSLERIKVLKKEGHEVVLKEKIDF